MLIHLDFFLGFIQMKFIFKNKKNIFLNNIIVLALHNIFLEHEFI